MSNLKIKNKQRLRAEDIFDKKVELMMLSINGIFKMANPNIPWPQYELLTRVGKMTLSVRHDKQAPWIACRFEDPEAVKPLLDLPPVFKATFAGKWNHALWHDYSRDFDRGLDEVKKKIQKLL